MKKGMEAIEVINYYDENNSSILIPLKSIKNAFRKCTKIFYKISKSKKCPCPLCKNKLKKHKEKLVYFESLLQQVETASPKDIAEIREELMKKAIFGKQKKQKKKPNAKPVLDLLCL